MKVEDNSELTMLNLCPPNDILKQWLESIDTLQTCQKFQNSSGISGNDVFAFRVENGLKSEPFLNQNVDRDMTKGQL